MAFFRQNKNLVSENNTGFGVNSKDSGGRFYNRKTGRANVTKKGIGILNRYSWYHTMIYMKRGKFLFLLFLIYIFVNLIFAGIYYAIGIDHLSGINKGSFIGNFTEVFFFSTQTFTTVGYGRISPIGFMTSAVATFEAFLGLLSFAIATGLFYGRFSRPQAFLKFSDKAIIAPYKNGIGLMIRMAPYKNNALSEVEAKLTTAMEVEENGKKVNKFYTLDLEMSKISALVLSWTLVHPITEKSPFYGWAMQDIINADTEIFAFVKAFDEVFSNTVIGRTSFIASEIEWGARFKMMYHPNADNSKTILNLSLLNSIEKVNIPEPATIS